MPAHTLKPRIPDSNADVLTRTVNLDVGGVKEAAHVLGKSHAMVARHMDPNEPDRIKFCEVRELVRGSARRKPGTVPAALRALAGDAGCYAVPVKAPHNGTPGEFAAEVNSKCAQMIAAVFRLRVGVTSEDLNSAIQETDAVIERAVALATLLRAIRDNRR